MVVRDLKKMVREAEIEKYGKCELLKAGCLVYKFVSPAKRGVPDDLVITPTGKTIYVEYKTPQGKLSKLQKVEIEKIKKQGALVYIIDSYDFVDKLVAAINEDLSVGARKQATKDIVAKSAEWLNNA